MSQNDNNEVKIIKMLIEEIEKNHNLRYGDTIYVRIRRGKMYELLPIDSDVFKNYMARKLYQEKDFILYDKNLLKAISIIKGNISEEQIKNLSIRVAYKDGSIYIDHCDIQSEVCHCTQISKDGRNTLEIDTDMFMWNSFQKPLPLPSTQESRLDYLKKYVNVCEEDYILYLVYLISCFIPHIQHPILNVNGEHGTGKTTVCKLLKSITDPADLDNIDFGDGEMSIKLPLSQNHITVFDNIESLSKKLNSLFCRSVTGGGSLNRELYTNNRMIKIPMKSLVIFNGISSVIRREDLMSRTLFIKTNSLKKYDEQDMLISKFNNDAPAILAGIFDTLAKALKIKENLTINTHFRMMEFASWGYAIAEAIETGLGQRFLADLKKNESVQLEETYMNEPLIPLISNYMKMRREEAVSKTMSSFFDDLMKNLDLYPGGSSTINRKLLPTTPATLSKKLKSLLSVFEKMGIHIEFDKTHDYRNLSRIAIEMIDTDITVKDPTKIMGETFKEEIIRKAILGIRKPVIGIRNPVRFEV